jgi:predicted RNase H-like nuclease (RuvC/YqgF family)
MEGLETRFRRYKREIERQEKENAALQKKVDEAKPSMKDKLAQGNLLSEVNDLRRFYSAVPDDIRREVETALKQPHSHGRGQIL